MAYACPILFIQWCSFVHISSPSSSCRRIAYWLMFTFALYPTCKWMLTPQGVNQVMDILTGLPGIIIFKALWATFCKEKWYIGTAYYLLLVVKCGANLDKEMCQQLKDSELWRMQWIVDKLPRDTFENIPRNNDTPSREQQPALPRGRDGIKSDLMIQLR